MSATWIRCEVAPGQFGNEYVVKSKDAHGRIFSLFCPEEYVELESEKEPTFDAPCQGWIIVQVVEKKQAHCLVRLPRHTLENGPYVTVESASVVRRPAKQRA